MSDGHAHPPTPDTEPLGISIRLVLLLSAIFVLLLGTILGATQAGVRYAYQLKEQERWLLPNADLDRLEREQLERISRYGVVDADAGVYTIPIDRAIEAVVERGE